jgi:hypothetical protein
MKLFLILALVLTTAIPVLALNYDQNVTPDVIFGSGNANGSFTTGVAGGIELGLRAKLRFNASNLPESTYNSNGDGSYSFIAGAAPSGFGWLPGSPTTPVWNFEFTVNTDMSGTSGLVLADLTYELGLDFDPSPAGTNYLVFDPITPSVPTPMYDHSLGNNMTTDATDVIAGDPVAYASALGTLNVAQNSWNYEFFNDAPFDSFDPADNAVYEIFLRAYDGSGAMVAETAISIVIGNAVANEEASWSEVKSLFR